MVGISDIIGGIFSPIKDIVSEVVVDKDKRDQVNLELARLEDQAQARLDAATLGQIEVNKVEAANGSIFVAGWRPFVGWVGGVGFGYNLIVQPFSEFLARVNGYSGTFPTLDNTLIITIMGGMLGIGGMRTFEKVKGVSTNTMKNVPDTPATTDVQVTPKGEVSVQTKGASPTVVAPAPKKKFKIF
jgi:hypothetical protein